MKTLLVLLSVALFSTEIHGLPLRLFNSSDSVIGRYAPNSPFLNVEDVFEAAMSSSQVPSKEPQYRVTLAVKKPSINFGNAGVNTAGEEDHLHFEEFETATNPLHELRKAVALGTLQIKEIILTPKRDSYSIAEILNPVNPSLNNPKEGSDEDPFEDLKDPIITSENAKEAVKNSDNLPSTPLIDTDKNLDALQAQSQHVEEVTQSSVQQLTLSQKSVPEKEFDMEASSAAPEEQIENSSLALPTSSNDQDSAGGDLSQAPEDKITTEQATITDTVTDSSTPFPSEIKDTAALTPETVDKILENSSDEPLDDKQQPVEPVFTAETFPAPGATVEKSEKLSIADTEKVEGAERIESASPTVAVAIQSLSKDRIKGDLKDALEHWNMAKANDAHMTNEEMKQDSADIVKGIVHEVAEEEVKEALAEAVGDTGAENIPEASSTLIKEAEIVVANVLEDVIHEEERKWDPSGHAKASETVVDDFTEQEYQVRDEEGNVEEEEKLENPMRELGRIIVELIRKITLSTARGFKIDHGQIYSEGSSSLEWS